MWNLQQRYIPVLLSLIVTVSGKSGVSFNTFKLCDPNVDYDLKINITITLKENKQYLDGTIFLKSPLDNNLVSFSSVEMLTGNKYMHVLSITERKTCDSMHKYFGEFAYEIERQAQLIPGMCPIPKGTYRVHNVLLNYQKIATIDSFPFGNLHVMDFIRYRNNSIYTCLDLELENHGYF